VQADNRAGIAFSSRTPATLELCSRAGCSRRLHERHTFRHGAAFPTNWKRTTRLTAKGEKKERRGRARQGLRLVRAKRGRVNIITTSLCPDRRYASAASAADSRIPASQRSPEDGPRWESFGGIYVKAVSRRMLIFARAQYSGYRDTRGVRVIAGEGRRSVMEDTIRGFYVRLRESARET